MSKEVERYEAMLLEDNPRLQDILPQGAILCGKKPVEVYLASDYESLLAERDALAKDAERYRYLRQHLLGVSFDWNGEGITALEFEMPSDIRIGADCDKNIDAALQGARP
jgi:hypothetical protein